MQDRTAFSPQARKPEMLKDPRRTIRPPVHLVRMGGWLFIEFQTIFWQFLIVCSNAGRESER